MNLASLICAIDSLNIDDRIRLVEAIWDGIAAERPVLLTHHQRHELDRRLAADEATPQELVSWECVRAEAIGRTIKTIEGKDDN